MKAAWIAIAIALLVGLPTVSVGAPATVPQIPTPPTNLTSCGSSPTSVCLRWTGGTGSPLINNTVYYGLSCSSVTGVSTGLQGVSGSTFFYNLTGLHPSTSYCLWATDWSQVGQSTPSSQLMVSTSAAPLGAQGSPITRDLITIWNNASVPTGTYQQLIVIDSARLVQQISSNWSNVAFAYLNGTPIFAWVESNATTTSHATYVWLKLNSIPATSSIVIEMDCYAWSVQKSSVKGPTGKSPQLTATYGGEDDGAREFHFYDGFAGTNLAGTSSTTIGFTGGSSYVQNNGLTVIVSGGAIDSNLTFPGSPLEALDFAGNLTSQSATTNTFWGFADNGREGFLNDMGNCAGATVSTWYLYQANVCAVGSTVAGAGLYTVLWTGCVAGGYAAILENYRMVSNSTANLQCGPMHIGGYGPGSGSAYTIQWLRVRDLPTGFADTALPSYALSYSLPDSPSSVSASRIAPSTTLLRWSNPLIDPSAPAKNTLVNDTVLYGSNPAILDHRASVGVATTATIGNLTPGVREWFSVQAWNSNGASSITDPVPDSGTPPPSVTTTSSAAPPIPIFWWLVFGLAVFAILGSFVLVLAVSRRDRDD